MKKLLSAVFILAISLWATTNESFCNTPSTPNSNPDGSCTQHGFVCNLGFNVNGENNIMHFNLGADSTCTDLLTSSLAPKDSTQDSTAWIFLVENHEGMGPLSLTLAGSLAMIAVNNNQQVNIIYKKVDNIPFGGIKLLSIQLYNTPATTTP